MKKLKFLAVVTVLVTVGLFSCKHSSSNHSSSNPDTGPKLNAIQFSDNGGLKNCTLAPLFDKDTYTYTLTYENGLASFDVMVISTSSNGGQNAVNRQYRVGTSGGWTKITDGLISVKISNPGDGEILQFSEIGGPIYTVTLKEN